MIRVKDISKSYGEVRALRDVSFEVEKGERFGLIGPDGAGKTSLFRMLATLLLPDTGEAYVSDYNIVKDYQKIRGIVGYMPGRFSLYQDLSVKENLEFFATVFGTTINEHYNLIRDIYEQIEPFRDRRVGALSGGMKQKLALCCSLIHKPSVLLLDEPTTGVDPVSRKEFWDILKGLKKAEITILVSTPFMDEAAKCERIALINKGKILDVDTPEGIRKKFDQPLYSVRSKSDMHSLLADIRSYDHTSSIFAFGEVAHYTDERDESDVVKSALKEYLQNKDHEEVEVNRIDPGVENTFIKYMTENE